MANARALTGFQERRQ